MPQKIGAILLVIAVVFSGQAWSRYRHHHRHNGYRPAIGSLYAMKASWYGKCGYENGQWICHYHGRQTASGVVFDMRNPHMVAHPSLALGSKLHICSRYSCIWAIVVDRGPYVGNRQLDASQAGAIALGYRDRGVETLRVTYMGHVSNYKAIFEDMAARRQFASFF